MTPFQQSRVWLRQASPTQRLFTAVTAAVVIGLLGWLMAPVATGRSTLAASPYGSPGAAGGGAAQAGSVSAGAAAGSSSGSAGGSAAPGSGPSTPSGASSSAGNGYGRAAGVASATGPNAPGATTSGGTTSNGGQAPVGAAGCPPGGDQGVSASQISVAVTVLDIGGQAGDSAFGIPSPTEQENDWNWVADDINRHGGAACRKLSLSFYSVNSADPSNAQQQCLAIAGAHPFITIDTAALSVVGAADCIPEQKIPLITTGVTTDQLKNYYPYYVSFGDILQNSYRNGSLALAKLGWLSPAKHFAKLGILYHDCIPAMETAQVQALEQAGLASNQIVEYDLACPTAQENTPADYEQAILAFKQAGVTDVTEVNALGSLGTFTRTAQQQGFNPQYIFDDGGLPASSSNPTSPLSPDPTNFANAVDVLGGRFGEQDTPNYQPSTATQQCNAIFAVHGAPPVYQQGDGYGGIACAYLQFVVLLVDHAPALQRVALVSGMHSIGSLDLTYPFGPIDFGSAPVNSGYGLNDWRNDIYLSSCTCWQVQDPTFHPPFP